MNKEIFNAMDKIIRFFSNDEKWQMKPSTNRIVQGLSMQAREESLRRNIIETLRGKDLYSAQLQDIVNQLIYERHLSQGKSAHTNALNFLGCLVAHFPYTSLPCLTSDEICWLHAKNLLSELDNESSSIDNISFISMDSKIDSISESIRLLRTKGYQVKIFGGHPHPTHHDTEKFKQEMKLLFADLGDTAIKFALKEIGSTWNKATGQYEMEQPFSFPGKVPPQVPYGYLLNMALSFLGDKCTTEGQNLESLWERAKVLSTHFIATYELQTPDIIDQMIRSPMNLMYELDEIAIYSHIIAPPLIPPEHIIEMLSTFNKYMTEQIAKENASEYCNAYLAILGFVRDKTSLRTGFQFTRDELDLALKGCIDPAVLKDCLGHLSTDIGDLNAGYPDSAPYIARTINAYERPFVRSGNTYYFFDKNIFSVGFYRVWYKTCLKNKRVIGELYEKHLAMLFAKHNIDILNNFEYFIPKGYAIGNANSGECDFILDTELALCVFEVKAKNLNADFLSGDEVCIMDDIRKSLLPSAIQLTKHEIYLRTIGGLKSLSGGTNIRFSPRKEIIKIHVSFLDRRRMHNSFVFNRILRALTSFSFSSDVEKFAAIRDPLACAQEEFISLCKHDVLRKAYDSNSKFMRSFLSISLPHLIVLLSNCKNTGEFVKKLKGLYRTHSRP